MGHNASFYASPSLEKQFPDKSPAYHQLCQNTEVGGRKGCRKMKMINWSFLLAIVFSDDATCFLCRQTLFCCFRFSGLSVFSKLWYLSEALFT